MQRVKEVTRDLTGQGVKEATATNANKHVLNSKDVCNVPGKVANYQGARSHNVTFEPNPSIMMPAASYQASALDESPRESSSNIRKMEDVSNDIAQKGNSGYIHEQGRHMLSALLPYAYGLTERNNKMVAALLRTIAGCVIGGIVYVILIYSFDYTVLQAGIICSVSTVIVCIGLEISSLCRCIMTLLLPNFITGNGRAVFLAIIFGIILSGPITDIMFNAQETGNSMACFADLTSIQANVMQQNIEKPIAILKDYVKEQKKELQAAVDKMNKGLDVVHLSLTKTLSTLENVTTHELQNFLTEKCKQPVQEACRNLCAGSIVSIIGCNKCNDLSKVCDINFKTTDNFVFKAAKKTSQAMNEVFKMFQADFVTDINYKGKVNASQSEKSVREKILNEHKLLNTTLTTIIGVSKKLLSLSLLLLFLQSFWYIRNYLSKDSYDNVYITKQFIEMDNDNVKMGRSTALPLKEREKNMYVETSSLKLNSFEIAYCKLGLVHVVLHFIFCVLVIIVDWSMYYILNLSRKYGEIDMELKSQGSLSIKVDGVGPIADFYTIIFKGLNVNENLGMGMQISHCFPKPHPVSVHIIPVLAFLYTVAVGFVLLQAYAMRLRRKIAAYYYPDQEVARIEFLHKTIRHERSAFGRFLRQNVISSHKENTVRQKLRLSTWLLTHCPCLVRCIPSRDQLECTSCGRINNQFHQVQFKKCTGEIDGDLCKAVYCEECRIVIADSCPLCSPEGIMLRH